MANFQEIVNKIFGLDQTKEYEIKIEEAKKNIVSNNVPPTVVVPPDNKTIETPPPTADKVELSTAYGSTVENQANDMQAMQAEINNLKAANLALLQRMPVQQEEKSVEEMIYELCVPQKKGVSNGIHKTGSGA